MKKLFFAILISLIPALIISCSKSKQMTPEDFIKIQNDFLSSDQTERSKETVSHKYGFSAKDYDDYDKKVESDAALKAKLGELRLKIPTDKK
jgi:hypothetical protein